MLSHDSMSRSKMFKAMTEQQFEEVVSAILDGKYSLACMLILEFAGYNPLYYFPRRTFTRLKKEHKRKDIDSTEKANSSFSKQDTLNLPISETSNNRSPKPKIRDLTYIDRSDSSVQKVQGRGIENPNSNRFNSDQEFNPIEDLYLKVVKLIPTNLW